MQPREDIQTKLFTQTMDNSVQILDPVDISLIISRWNEGSVLGLYKDSFEDLTGLVII